MSVWTGIKDKTVVVTGGTNGIGLAAVKQFARAGANLVIIARNELRGRQAMEAIGCVAPTRAVTFLVADLASQQSVRELAQEILTRHPRINILINNAGAMFWQRQLTGEGIERTWALNHLAPFLLTNLLLDRLKQSSPCRIINTASAAHAHHGVHIRFDDLNAERHYRGFQRYSETKLANILFTRELARRLRGTEVSATCFHPGLVATGFNHNNGLLLSAFMVLIRPFCRSPEKGAETLVWLANSPELPRGEGNYFIDCRVATPTAEAQDGASAERLWQLSEEQTRISINRSARN